MRKLLFGIMLFSVMLLIFGCRANEMPLQTLEQSTEVPEGMALEELSTEEVDSMELELDTSELESLEM